MRRILVAVGGNAISPPNKRESVAKRLRRLRRVMAKLKPIFKKYRVLLTHGNGFDVGVLSLRIPTLPLDTLDAMTQGQLGYWLEHAIASVLRKEVVTIVTRVLVDPKDRAFNNPTKPVGSFYRKKISKHMIAVPGKGFRRVVASPKPVRILEAKTIRRIFQAGITVIAGGGGGIPVVRKRNQWRGIEAVIDKDRCAVLLAKLIRADTLLILTNVDGVYLNYGKRNQKKLRQLTLKKARKFLRAGEFGLGDMKPKIESAIAFLRAGGKQCFVGPLERPWDTLQAKTGTKIVQR